MRPGPDLAALAAAGHVIRYGVCLDVYRGGVLLASDVPVASGAMTVTGDQVGESVRLEVGASNRPRRATDPFAPRGQELHCTIVLEIDGARVEIGLPPCKIRSWQLPSGGDKMTVTGAGMLRLIEQTPWAWPSSPVPGSTLLREARRLVKPVPVYLEPGTPDPVLPRGIAWSEKQLDALDDLAATYGVQWLMRADGALWGRSSTPSDVPVAHYGAAELLDDTMSDTDERPNVVVAWSAEDRDKASRRRVATASIQAAGEPMVREIVELEAGRSQAQVHQAAWAAVHRHLATVQKRTVQIPPDPRLEIGDVISCALPGRPALVGRVTGYELPFDHSTPMRVDMEAHIET